MSENNASIKVVDTKDKGRALVASLPLKAGQIILRDSHILLYSAFPLGGAGAGATSNYCCHCFRTIAPNSTAMVSCPRCSKASIFCSPQCLSISISTSHTPFVCQALSCLHASNSLLLHHNHDRHIQARFLISAYNLAVVSPSHFQTLLSLQGEPIIDDASNFLHSMISSICFSFLDNGQFGFSLELTASLLAKDKLNAFGLMEPFDQDKERSVRAYGIYPKASFFNHDCLPNACRFDYVDSISDCSNTDIVVRVIHDVPEGREICLSYFPVNLKYLERQQRLKDDYDFTCDCDRCKVEANWSDNEEEGEVEMEEDGMDEDDIEADSVTEDCGVAKEDNDFPHAYFFIRYMCNRDNCWGTLAPLTSADARPSAVMECNVCGNLSNSENLMDGNS